MFTMTFFFALFLLATSSLASPPENQTPHCPWNGVANADNFTLLAVFKTDNGTREPLALGSNRLPDPQATSPRASWLGSAGSINSIIAKYFVLTDGELTAYAPDDGSLVAVSNHVANKSGQLSFFRPDYDDGATGYYHDPAKSYCELFNTSPHGVEFPFTLAVNSGDSDHLSLCQSTTSNESIVIYNAVGPNSTDSDSGYKPGTCVGIIIHMLHQ